MIAILLSTLLMAADTTPSSSAAASPVTAAAPAKTNGSEVTCWEERPTGSHVAKKVCATRDQLDKAKRDADDAVAARNLGPSNPFGPSRK